MNYGHQAVYSPTQTEDDFSYLYSMGIRGLRIAMASIGSPRIIDEQDMIVRALAHGFSVIWGIVVPTLCDINAWNAHIAYVESTLLSWAIANNLPTLSRGNERE